MNAMTKIAQNKVDIVAFEERQMHELNIEETIARAMKEIQYAVDLAEDTLGDGEGDQVICNVIIELHKMLKPGEAK